MTELVFIVPGRLDQITGGYLFDRHVVEGLRARGRGVRVIELTVQHPQADAARLAGLADGAKTVVDGLALANLGEVVAAHACRLRLVAFVHGPLAQEIGLAPAEAKRAAQLEAALLLRLRGVSVRAGELPLRSRAMASPETESPSSHRERQSRTSICGRGAAQFERCSASRTWSRARAIVCWSRRWRGSTLSTGTSSASGRSSAIRQLRDRFVR